MHSRFGHIFDHHVSNVIVGLWSETNAKVIESTIRKCVYFVMYRGAILSMIISCMDWYQQQDE